MSGIATARAPLLEGVSMSTSESRGLWASLRWQASCIVCVLVACNIACFAALLVASRAYPNLASPGILAFTFGLRHAVDADHIAAIDNVTRKLVQDGKWPLTVGLWFSLGHSSVVGIMCVATMVGSSFLQNQIDSVKGVGELIGTTVSATLLFIVGILNLVIARKLLLERQRRRSGEQPLTHSHKHDDEERCGGHQHLVAVNEDAEVTGGGIIANCCPRLFRFVDTPVKMFPIGLLFGLGFGTASEVALLAMAAVSSRQGMPSWCTLILPLLFSAGMALVDTLDGLMMLCAYEWAVIAPDGKLMFNMLLTVSSALIALVVGLIEALGCLQEQMALSGGLWDFIAAVNENTEYVGYSIVVFFALSILIAIVHFKSVGAKMQSPVTT